MFALIGCNKEHAENAVQRQHRTEDAAAKQRFDKWAYVAKEKEIAPGETVRLLIIPGQYGDDSSDTKCIIYTHQDFKQSNMICPDASKEDLVGSGE